MSGIYVHFPFCTKKCLYCNFYSVRRTDLRPKYIEALSREIELRKEGTNGDRIETIYFGGGTPSLCTISELAAVTEKLNSSFIFASETEFTIEGNPEQLTKEYLSELKKMGINRISIGVQSFNDNILTLLGRTHNAATAKKAIENALAAGFDNISIDLIYGISSRQSNEWLNDLKEAFSFPITHLSAYSLTVEENTLLHRKIKSGELPQLNENCAITDYWTLLEEAEKNNFKQYEISNFAKENKISRHNHSYWVHTPYIGLGAAAHSFNGKERSWNIADVTKYIDGCMGNKPYREKESLSPIDIYNEYVLLRLRTSDGISLTELQQQFGQERRKKVENYLTSLPHQFIGFDGTQIHLTHEGLLHADNIAMEMFETTPHT